MEGTTASQAIMRVLSGNNMSFSYSAINGESIIRSDRDGEVEDHVSASRIWLTRYGGWDQRMERGFNEGIVGGNVRGRIALGGTDICKTE